MSKIILYVIIFPFTIWALDGLDLNRFFKQSSILQARIIYSMLAISISHLVVNFLYDFITSFKII